MKHKDTSVRDKVEEINREIAFKRQISVSHLKENRKLLLNGAVTTETWLLRSRAES